MVPQHFLDALSIADRRRRWDAIFAATHWPDTGIFVLVDRGEVIGFAHICPSRDNEENVGEVTSIYILREHWSRGGGQALMRAALASMRAANFSEATLWVLDGNTHARSFYVANGWTADGADKVDEIGGAEIREVRYRRALA